MQTLKNTINYKQVLGMADKSEILAPAKEVFKMISDASDAELQDNSKMLPIHGDFWTGKYVMELDAYPMTCADTDQCFTSQHPYRGWCQDSASCH